MEWPLVLALFFAALLGLMLTGLPVFVAFLVVNLGGLLLLIGPRGFGLFANSVFDSVTAGAFAAIPLFLLMGEILFRSGSVEVLFDSVDRIVGRLRGRLYLVVIALSTVFGALSGSAVAVAALLGRSTLPTMTKRGYSDRLSAGVILAGASLAPIIPPSLLAIIVGSLADVSIAGLLVAGIVPGLILALLTAGWIAVALLRDPSLAPAEPREDLDRGGVALALLRMSPFLLIILAVMGLIVLGIATPSESAATGVLGAVAVAAVYRRCSLAMLLAALASATRISAMILVIVAASKLFSQLLAFTGATRALVAWSAGLGLDPMVMFVAMMLVPFLLCMFLDQVAFLLMAVPLYGPLVAALGFDPIWFWTIFLINLTLGSITPPFGYTLFALIGAAPQVGLGTVYRASLPVIVIFLAGMTVFALWPVLVTWLPGIL
ncbi:MAG: TRAP transporter large permease subunit [Rhodospirillales bacterium]